MSSLVLKNCKAVTKDKVINNATIIINEDGVIEDLDSSLSLPIARNNEIDLDGAFVFPGIIDTHSDYFEREIMPRKRTIVPFQDAFFELDKKLAVQGITTMYHSPSMYEEEGENWVRNNSSVNEIIEGITKFKNTPHLINHKIHLRLEIPNKNAVSLVEELLHQNKIDQISFMDHTPGQGQVSNINSLNQLMVRVNNISVEEASERILALQKKPRISYEELKKIATLANDKGIPLSSHDDDTREKVKQMKGFNVTISEFPVSHEAAVAAREEGLYIVMGAPNLLQNKSHMGNLSAQTALKDELVDILCSDYLPSSLIKSMFYLIKNGWDIEKAANLVSYNPALAMNIAKSTGSIDVNKTADLLIVRGSEKKELWLEQVFVKGKQVCALNY